MEEEEGTSETPIYPAPWILCDPSHLVVVLCATRHVLRDGLCGLVRFVSGVEIIGGGSLNRPIPQQALQDINMDYHMRGDRLMREGAGTRLNSALTVGRRGGGGREGRQEGMNDLRAFHPFHTFYMHLLCVVCILYASHMLYQHVLQEMLKGCAAIIDNELVVVLCATRHVLRDGLCACWSDSFLLLK